jgi:septum formation protein
MLEEMRIEFEIVPADTEEQIDPGEAPAEFAMRMAARKGRAVADRLWGVDRRPWIIGADTVVVLDGAVMGKPRNDREAREMLGRLSGRTHRVVTGWAVGRKQDSWIVEHSVTAVLFHGLTEKQIADYAATGEGMDKAGAYAIQGIGAFLVERVDGSYFNVVGLPISHVVRALVKVGALDAYPLS